MSRWLWWHAWYHYKLETSTLRVHQLNSKFWFDRWWFTGSHWVGTNTSRAKQGILKVVFGALASKELASYCLRIEQSFTLARILERIGYLHLKNGWCTGT